MLFTPFPYLGVFAKALVWFYCQDQLHLLIALGAAGIGLQQVSLLGKWWGLVLVNLPWLASLCIRN